MKEGLVPGRKPEAIAKCLLMDFNSGLYSINLILILQNLLTAVCVHLDGLNGSPYLAHHVISYPVLLYIYIFIYNPWRGWHGNVHGNVNVFGPGGIDLLYCCCGRASTYYCQYIHNMLL